VLQGTLRNAELLLFADQFEEIFSARVEERHREPFIGLIDTIASSPRIRLVLTLRADYYEHCTRDPRLAALLRDGSFPLAAPTPLALAEMIEGPARVAGLELRPGLSDAILKDAGTEPGALALVEFALEELYERSGGKQLTVAAYRALGGKDRHGGEVSGIGGGLSRARPKRPCRMRLGKWTRQRSPKSSPNSRTWMRKAARCASARGSTPLRTDSKR